MERAAVLRTRELIGWTVTDPDGATVGTVTELLVGRDGLVRFLAVRRGRLGSSILVPADELTWGDEAMRLSRWTQEDVRRVPAWDPDRPLTDVLLDEMARAHPRYYGSPPRWDAPAAAAEERIVPLAEAKDFRLPKDAPDPRGWEVFAADNERVGAVAGLLVDPRALKVRYLDVDLADDLFLLKEDRHVVIPMEAVDLRERGRDAWIRGLPAREVAALPAYGGGALDPLVETSVRRAFSGWLRGEGEAAAAPEGEHDASPEPAEERDDHPEGAPA